MDQVTTVSVDSPALPSTDLLRAAGGLPRRGALLVVEDRDDVRQGLSQLLELHGFLVFDAADGEQALDILNGDPENFALVLLDLMLPGSLRAYTLIDSGRL